MEERSNNTAGNSVRILPVRNSACIICGKDFNRERAGKLYCSSKCRQAGYYHKDKILVLRQSQHAGISNNVLEFSLKEYKKYCLYQERIKNYRKLERQFGNIPPGSPEWDKWYKNPNCALSWERKKIPKRIIDLPPIPLSIEQWSFLKALYPDFDLIGFIEFVSSLSVDFVRELTDSEVLNSKNPPRISPIRIKYLHHLNKIVNNEVKFVD